RGETRDWPASTLSISTRNACSRRFNGIGRSLGCTERRGGGTFMLLFELLPFFCGDGVPERMSSSETARLRSYNLLKMEVLMERKGRISPLEVWACIPSSNRCMEVNMILQLFQRLSSV